ncbi:MULTISPECIES: imidazolonepropionase [Sphingobacterium]|uniref:Imidazolonepropionase n=1 Tax=Sphingobacterium cellulitidis TaxID=1768011 RepID=A0A8H9KVY0_9SPHI|nr:MULTISPECIES: imidazolonepropionase [Sphingobacterium]MBA8988721.1 imidazolonepropionase [Sphingobacterium soli]OYD43274.1 imidazolonepropionase [Sphingobacterium cellulitidis]OYD47387.1 imidazolonepropionase [Sphingobacterium cellulitidis]WFB62669.1 imidazolonepropionase [Sphingobacterium sp. WM]GGE35615.1 imidazolonepropionase [Sphingobacterium soli]
MKENGKLIGPFKQVLTMQHLPLKGALKDEQLEIIEQAGINIVDGKIKVVGDFEGLKAALPDDIEIVELKGDFVALPGYIDCHTHIAFGGNRANDFAMRNAGSSYLEIAEAGGGIWSTVKHTRECSQDELKFLTLKRADNLLRQGITTVEVKSGYGLNVEEELKTLRAIKEANQASFVDLISTCLAAHMHPKDYEGNAEDYLYEIGEKLFPLLRAEELTNRIDAFVEKSAFSAEQILPYYKKAKEMGFDLTVHADQFSTSGSKLAVELAAVSADHLEASTENEISLLAGSDVIPVALPAASLGIGCEFTPARKLLDAGASLAIATDWNPGSAPMGKLIESASILATMQKLSNAELFAGITFRAAKALNLQDRGRLMEGMLADLVIYDTDNYQNITYLQGGLQPKAVWKNGTEVFVRKD